MILQVILPSNAFWRFQPCRLFMEFLIGTILACLRCSIPFFHKRQLPCSANQSFHPVHTNVHCLSVGPDGRALFNVIGLPPRHGFPYTRMLRIAAVYHWRWSHDRPEVGYQSYLCRKSLLALRKGVNHRILCVRILGTMSKINCSRSACPADGAQ